MATLIPFDNIYLRAMREKQWSVSVVSGQKEKDRGCEGTSFLRL
jgi:hypothetical protein